MQSLTQKQQNLIAGLKRFAEREGLAEHLAAARELARKDVPAGKIDFMMRGLFSKPAIEAMIAEAQALKAR